MLTHVKTVERSRLYISVPRVNIFDLIISLIFKIKIFYYVTNIQEPYIKYIWFNELKMFYFIFFIAREYLLKIYYTLKVLFTGINEPEELVLEISG